MKHSDFHYELLELQTSRTNSNTNANAFADENHASLDCVCTICSLLFSVRIGDATPLPWHKYKITKSKKELFSVILEYDFQWRTVKCDQPGIEIINQVLESGALRPF